MPTARFPTECTSKWTSFNVSGEGAVQWCPSFWTCLAMYMDTSPCEQTDTTEKHYLRHSIGGR